MEIKLSDIESEKEVNDFLEFLKKEVFNNMGETFDYTILKSMEDVAYIIKECNISLNVDFSYNIYGNYYNPILCWEVDNEIVYINSWYAIRRNIEVNNWCLDEEQQKLIIAYCENKDKYMKKGDIIKSINSILELKEIDESMYEHMCINMVSYLEKEILSDYGIEKIYDEISSVLILEEYLMEIKKWGE